MRRRLGRLSRVRTSVGYAIFPTEINLEKSADGVDRESLVPATLTAAALES